MQKYLSVCIALFGLAALSCAANPVQAQDADSQVWGLFTFNARFPNHVRFYAEVQPRIGENYDRNTQLLIRPAVGYQINRTFSLWLGYGWTPSFFPEFNGENRVFQQLLWEDGYHGTSITNRFRLEERFIEHAGETAWRARHQLRLSRPVSKGSQWAYVGYDELFWHLNTTPRGPKSGFDQNRLFLGMSYTVSRHGVSGGVPPAFSKAFTIATKTAGSVAFCDAKHAHPTALPLCTGSLILGSAL